MDNETGSENVKKIEVVCNDTEDDSDDGNAVGNVRGKNCSEAKNLQVKAFVHSEPFCAKALSSNIRKAQAENNSTVTTLKTFNDSSSKPSLIKTNGKLSNVITPPKVTTEKLFDGHYQPVRQGQSLMTGEENLILKEKGYTFDAKNLENGVRKRDPNIANGPSPTDVMSEETKEQFDANTGQVQKYDAPNDDDDDDDQNDMLPCMDKQLASQPSSQNVIDVQHGYVNSSKGVQSCEIVPNVKNEESNERMKLQKISTLVWSKMNLLLDYAATTIPTSSSFTNTQ